MLTSLRRLWRDQAGATLVFVAAMLPVLFGIAALGIDYAQAVMTKTALQTGADAAAMSAVTRLPDAAAVDITALQYASANLAAAEHGTAVTAADVTTGSWNNVTHVFTAGSASPDAVQVIASRDTAHANVLKTIFAGAVGVTPFQLQAKAIAQIKIRDPGCVLALDPTAPQAVLINGAANLNLLGCALYDDSSQPTSAMLENGSASITAQAVYVVGGILKNGNASVTAADGVHTGANPIADPYASVPPPTFSGCNKSNEVVNGQVSRSYAAGATPYVFCGGMTVNGGGSVSFGPGVYVINGGSLIWNANVKVTATNATFYLTGGANLIINGQANVTISAPTSGPTAGLVFFMDRKSAGGPVTFNGGSTQAFAGALYFPSRPVTFNGGTSVAKGGCTQLIADTLIFNGNSVLETNCIGTGVKPFGLHAASLVL